MCREKLFGDVLDIIIAFLDYKISIQIGRKICLFPKGLVHNFGQKFDISSTFLLGKIAFKKLFIDALD